MTRSRSPQREIAVRRAIADASGAALIEFAFITPVLLMFVAGMLAYGLYICTAHSIQQLAADSARASVGGLTNSESAALALQQVTLHGGDYPLLDPARITVSAGPSPGDSTEFTVAISYDASALPIWGLQTIVPLPNRTITRTASIKRGGY
jgi:Flp pilus assembly protein TadG